MKIVTRSGLARAAALLASTALAAAVGWALCIRMPGTSFRGPLPPIGPEEQSIRAELARDVGELAGKIGERSFAEPESLSRAAAFVESELRSSGARVARQSYFAEGQEFCNIEATVDGGARAGEVVVVGAHYDSVMSCPGANDNASGVAALLALARRLARSRPAATIRFVAFANEEPPFFQQPGMGSLVYARRCRERGDAVVAMLSLETMGCFDDAEGSQRYPPPLGFLYPSRGDFIAFVGDFGSRALVRRAVAAFRARAEFPSEGAALPAAIPQVGWSDHWSFRQQGYPAIMVTDTAPFRYPHYHRLLDTPDKVDYDRLARVVRGLAALIVELSS
jgi:Zn-dependent M28 family amino/carboxypeptidase